MSIFLPRNASKAALRAAQQARRNRAEIVRELSWGRVSRRELIKMGLFTSAGMLAPIGGLNPFVASAKAQVIAHPTGAPPSPLFGCRSSRRDAALRRHAAQPDFVPQPRAAGAGQRGRSDPGRA